MYLITDRAPYHRASLVQDWSVVMNEHTRNNQYFATSKDFLQVINGFFSDILPEIAGKRDSHINDIFRKSVQHHQGDWVYFKRLGVLLGQKHTIKAERRPNGAD